MSAGRDAVEAVIFDLDGVIVDVYPDAVETARG